MSNNQLLYYFLKAYLEWLYIGAPHKKPFLRGCGLCSNAGVHYGHSSTEACDVKSLMQEIFKEEGLSEQYPFNEGSAHYYDEVESLKCHLNINRKVWVYTQVERLKHEDSLPRHTEIDVRV